MGLISEQPGESSNARNSRRWSAHCQAFHFHRKSRPCCCRDEPAKRCRESAGQEREGRQATARVLCRSQRSAAVLEYRLFLAKPIAGERRLHSRSFGLSTKRRIDLSAQSGIRVHDSTESGLVRRLFDPTVERPTPSFRLFRRVPSRKTVCSPAIPNSWRRVPSQPPPAVLLLRLLRASADLQPFPLGRSLRIDRGQ